MGLIKGDTRSLDYSSTRIRGLLQVMKAKRHGTRRTRKPGSLLTG